MVYDATHILCSRFTDKKCRTHDQLVQAAHDEVQNMAEGSLASAKSKKIELKLTGVARASLGELLLDFEDFLRQRKLCQWDKNDPKALAIRGKFRDYRSDRSYMSDFYRFPELSAEELANPFICLINQASYLF